MTRTLRFSPAPGCLEAAEQALWTFGAQAVTLLDAGDQPLHEPGPGQTPVWDSPAIEALLPDEIDVDQVVQALGANGLIDATGSLEIRALAERDWERAWMERFEPMRFGHGLWICPWHLSPDPDWPVVIRLDPGLAFGTGTHATTALCLEWIDAHEFTGRQVIDYGCGSGVLAVAAALKGAAGVSAVDHDPQALAATRDNAARNGVADRIRTLAPEQCPAGPVDCVLANILAGPLLELAPALSSRVAPGGELVLSGILADQADAVEQCYRQHLTLAGRAERDGWVRLDYRARRPSM